VSEDRISRVRVRVLDRDYDVACPAEERTALLDSAEFLDSRMREIRDSGKIVGLDRIAVIAALNLANELLRLKRDSLSVDSDLPVRLRALRDRVEAALDKGQQLEL
jgi:cell division protein ZapA